jgi:hypothetical protein
MRKMRSHLLKNTNQNMENDDDEDAHAIFGR